MAVGLRSITLKGYNFVPRMWFFGLMFFHPKDEGAINGRGSGWPVGWTVGLKAMVRAGFGLGAVIPKEWGLSPG